MATEASPLLNKRYKLLQPIGQGGMSVVYKAQDLSLGRLVAVKVLRETLTADTEFLARFQQEARNAANLAHQNIVTVHDFGKDGARYYIVMEYIEGKDLKTIIKEDGPFPVERAVDFAVQSCAGVGYAHRAGLVHCDIKPQNLLITEDGRVKITDFGIARALSTIRPGETTDVVWGSPQYYSPEQAAGEHPTPASDVYSIGVVMFEMLAGRLPFVASTQQALAMMHLREEPPLLSMFNPQVPEALERIIHKVMAKEPSARYRTADQLGRILISYRQQGDGMTAPLSGERERNSSSDPLRGATNVARSPAPQVAAGATPSRPTTPLTPSLPNPALQPTVVHIPEAAAPETGVAEEQGIDWIAMSLGFLAFIAVAGLVPLWIWVFLTYTR
ncbi:MAG: protein kinase domain-containing protein [Anaerolineales bacterium]